MLVKKQLIKIPLCPTPKVNKGELKNARIISAAQAFDNPSMGKILVVDNYNSKSGKLQARLFMDEKNHVIYDANSATWKFGYLSSVLWTDEEISSYSELPTIKTVKEFLNYSGGSYFWPYSKNISARGVIGIVDNVIQQREREKRYIANDKAEALFRERRSWFPKLNVNIETFCNKKAFKEHYIFFSTLDKKHSRSCKCSYCGEKWRTKKTLKHRSKAICPKCNIDAVYWAERYSHCIKNKTTVVTPCKRDGQLILRWLTAERVFADQKPRVSFSDDAYTFYLCEKGKNKIVSYFRSNGFFYRGSGWTKAFNGVVCYHKAYVYNENLKDVFGDKYYNVDLKKVLENQQNPIDFIALLDNLKNYPQTEYLCKMGLAELASQMNFVDFTNDGQSLIKKQYLPMYQKMNVSVKEHRLLNFSKYYIHPCDLEKIRFLNGAGVQYEHMQLALQYQTVDTLCKYISKQTKLTNATISHVSYWLRDYYNMCEVLNIPIERQTARPKNIKEAHDVLLERYNKIKQEIDAEKSRAALLVVNGWFKGYEKNGLCVKIPHERADFIREGQTLSHCVGGESYYKNHIAGKRMIFFIRKIEAKNKPYVTCEIDMSTYLVTQCYGFGDSTPPKEVKAFAKSFANYIGNQVTMARKAG